MKAFICRRSHRQIFAFFAVAYAVVLAMALFPPFYLASSGISYAILGMPLTICYWLLNAVLIVAILLAMNLVERVRGELDIELTDSEEEVAGS